MPKIRAGLLVSAIVVALALWISVTDADARLRPQRKDSLRGNRSIQC